MSLWVRSMFSKKKTCDYPLWKSTNDRSFDFVMWIAPTGDIHVLAIELRYIFAENDW